MKPKLPSKNSSRTLVRPTWFFALSLLAGLMATAVFVTRPEIDIAFSRLFVDGGGGFIFNHPGVGHTLRNLLKLVYWGTGITVLAGIGYTFYYRSELPRPAFPKWLYMGLCLVIGPGIVANGLLKETWGRARPLHIEAVGGACLDERCIRKQFSPALEPSDQCKSNCSFISGEASSMYMLFFALALMARRRRTSLFLAGVVAGSFTGLLRIGQGGHFLSDVIFAGVIMALTAQLLYWIVFYYWNRHLPEG